MKAVVVFIFVCFFSFEKEALCQDTVSFSYAFNGHESVKDNVINNDGAIHTFLEKLYNLKTSGRQQVNIVHIGDSHVQADFMTNVVRRTLQERFGNAGRGLVVPARVAGTNEPFNFRSGSNTTWRPKRVIFVNDSLPIGIGGISVQTDSPEAAITIKMNDRWMDYRFNKVMLFSWEHPSSFSWNVKDSLNNAMCSPITVAPGIYSCYLNGRSNQVTIATARTRDTQSQATLFGVNLSTDAPGVIYHSIGVNGAKFVHYNAAEFFAVQTQFLSPDLFVVALGTNEALDHPYVDKQFLSHVDSLVSNLYRLNPHASIILTTPGDSFIGKTKPNPGVQLVRNQLLQYAAENGIAFWDFFKVMGGEKSGHRWRTNGLLSSDGIHLTKAGYEYQGFLFCDALLKAYNRYVGHRHR